MIIKKHCPQCGTQMDFDDTREFMFCQYCGTRITKNGSGQTLPQTRAAANTANTANMIIDYTTTKPACQLTVVVNGQRWVFPNNSHQEFVMPPGVHMVFFYITSHGWKRAVNIPYSGAPVHISVVYAGRVKIYIQ